jgi:hypothetical protein
MKSLELYFHARRPGGDRRRLFARSKGIVIAVALASVTWWFSPSNVDALSSFARQTGQSCSTCHYSFPELNPTGREFKLNGYTLTAEKNIKAEGNSKTAELSLPQFVPLSASLLTSVTYTRLSKPGAQDPSVEVPQGLNLWLAGQILPNFGEAVQITYTASEDHFSFDSSDVRYVFQTTLFGEDLVLGIDSNNNPTFEDVWNSVPAWGFPFAGPDTAGFAPAATTIIDGPLATSVVGGGFYALFADHLYVLAEIYRSQHLEVTQPETGVNQSINIQYVAPYWRVAWQQQVGQNNYFEIGTYGIYVNSTNGSIGGPSSDTYLDLAADLTYELTLGNGDLISVHSTFIYESSDLESTPASVPNHTLETWRLDANYHLGNRFTFTAGPFITWGTSDSVLYPVVVPGPGIDTTPSFSGGSPNNLGYIGQVAFWPGQNFQIALQYRGFFIFNGASSNYDGNGRNASDNNTIYAFIWINY